MVRISPDSIRSAGSIQVGRHLERADLPAGRKGLARWVTPPLCRLPGHCGQAPLLLASLPHLPFPGHGM